MKDLWDTIQRPNLEIRDVEKGEEIQIKYIDN
jgi:hypothetical protein